MALQGREETALRAALAKLDEARTNSCDPWREHQKSVEYAWLDAMAAAVDFLGSLPEQS